MTSGPLPFPQRAVALVGAQDPLAILHATPHRLCEITKADPVDTLRRRPFPDKWTPLEIIGHFGDHEAAMSVRLRTMLADSSAVIHGYPQEPLVTLQRHNDRDPSALLAYFECLRTDNLRLWRLFTVDDLARTVTHATRGDEPIALHRTMHAGHDLVHLDQLTRYLDAAR